MSESYRSVFVHLKDAGLGSALEVASRQSFGMPKPYRAVWKDGTIRTGVGNVLFALEEWRTQDLKDPEYIEKEWPEVGWETAWQAGRLV
jgi:hypothetical protein